MFAKPAQQTAPPPEVTSYYYLGGKRVAMRKGSVVTWLHSDHLGSASLATDLNGIPVPGSETRYKPFGEIRFGSSGLPTDRRFTGYARERANYVGSLDFAQARYYSPLLGRFISADTVYDGGLTEPQGLNRYSYTRNRPLIMTDPSGHNSVLAALGFVLGGAAIGAGISYLGETTAQVFNEASAYLNGQMTAQQALDSSTAFQIRLAE